jgi:hypothetical protein
MPEDYEVVYSHPGGATAVFTRREGSLDAVARGLDSEQFWVFKNVKALLVRNDEGDLEEATRQMAAIGFGARVRRLEPALVGAAAGAGAAVATAPAPAGAYGALEHEEAHAGHLHGPAPSYWPLFTGFAVAWALLGLIFVSITPLIAALGLVMTFIGIVGWGVEPFEA